MKKQILSFLLALSLPAASLAAVTQTGTNEGTFYYPDESDPATATYQYHYSYPRFDDADEVAEAINNVFTYQVDDAAGFAVPMMGEMADGPASTDVRAEISYQDDDWMSVRILTTQHSESGDTAVLSAYVFALTGGRAGEVSSLPRVLGVLKDDETDEWMKDRQTERANTLVREMVWERLQERTLLPETTEQSLEKEFYPEQDFYLDAEGNPVFFLQAGTVADAAEGVMEVMIPLEELKDEW